MMGCPPSSVLGRARARALRAAGSPQVSGRTGFADSPARRGHGGNNTENHARVMTSDEAGRGG
jgi:hypothetical protein